MKTSAFILALLLGFVAAFADAQPAGRAQTVTGAGERVHSYVKYDLANPVLQLIGGLLTPVFPKISGVQMIVSPAVYERNKAVLAPYRDAQQTNLQHTYAGDDPANPRMTVALSFPTQRAADDAVALLRD